MALIPKRSETDHRIAVYVPEEETLQEESIYSERFLETLADEDCITTEEYGFMTGYIQDDSYEE